MYALYHHFLQKVKEEQIQKYNQKHKDYLIRSGKIVDQPVERKIRRNQNVNQVNHQPVRQIQACDNQLKQAPIAQNVGNKPRRQRQFNKPNQNSQPSQESKVEESYNKVEDPKINNDTVRTEKRGEFTRPKPVREVEQELPRNRIEMDRPIKQNKLTQEEIDFLNQTSVNQNKKMPVESKKTQREEQPVKQIPKKQPQLSQYQQVQVTLIECGICGRKFKQQALVKHENICEKVFQQKRKPFEVKITDEQAELLKKKNDRKNPKKNENVEKKQQEPKWKNQSQVLRNMVKRARGQKIQNEVVQIDTRIPCPACGRKFAEKAATKHIEFCTNKAKRPKN